MLKNTLRRVHLILAFASGLFLINLSISGALLLYAKDIQTFINPQYWLVIDNSNQTGQPLLPLSKLTESIELETKQQIQFIEPTSDNKKAWQVRLRNERYLSVNPYTGNILLAYDLSDTFYGFVMSWHRWLLYKDDQNNKPMQLLVSIASLILIIELIVGVILWLKPKHKLKSLKVRWQSKNKVRLMQLHGTIGVFFFIPLILIAFSGLGFYWPDQTKKIVEWLSFSKVESHNFKYAVEPKLTQFPQLSIQNKLQLDKAYNLAQLALPNGEVFRTYMPEDGSELLALRIKMPDESHAYSWSWANSNTGLWLNSFDASKASIATQVWNFKYKFHIGEFIGWPIKTLWLFISLMPCFFVCTGVYLWLKRRPN